MEQLTFICDECRRELPLAELNEIGDRRLCDGCHSWLTVECECCGEIFLRSEMHADTDICEECYEEHYVVCTHCGEIIEYSNALTDDCGSFYCRYCFEEKYPTERRILNYSYKPEPIFYGDDPRYFGVELEIDKGGYDHDHAGTIRDMANSEEEHLYIKQDGSLEDGFELVTHPMTLHYHQHRMPWRKVMDKALDLGYLSHKTATCGLHIHVNRTSLGDTREDQEDTIARIMFFFEANWEKVLRFSRRTPRQLEQWAKRYGSKAAPKEIMDEAKKGSRGRYVCINIMNYHTVEFRVFRGTLKYNTLIAALQFVNTICDAAFSMSDKEIADFTWDKFVESLDPDEHKELRTYLDERGIGKEALHERSSIVNR